MRSPKKADRFDFLHRPGRIPMLLFLNRHPTPVSMAELTRASGLSPNGARAAREDLATRGLLHINAPQGRGKLSRLEISLTPKGRRLVGQVAEVERLLREASGEEG